MNFMQLITSLDELLYEVMSWLIFFPVTLWRALRRPVEMMVYADTELSDAEDQQYIDTLNPPMLLPSLLLAPRSKSRCSAITTPSFGTGRARWARQ